MRIAGVVVRDADALALALLLRQEGHAHAADQIESACMSYDEDVRLNVEDRDAIIAVLLELNELAPLRSLHLLEHEREPVEGPA